MNHIAEIQTEFLKEARKWEDIASKEAEKKVTQIVGEDRPGNVAAERGNYPDRITNK